jgi:hypothetical protein
VATRLKNLKRTKQIKSIACKLQVIKVFVKTRYFFRLQIDA